MNTTNEEKQAKTKLLQKSWEYLCVNFHKFSEANQIKIALALVTKSMPTQIEGDVKYTQMSTVKIGDKPLELDFGEVYRASRDFEDAGKTDPVINRD